MKSYSRLGWLGLVAVLGLASCGGPAQPASTPQPTPWQDGVVSLQAMAGQTLLIQIRYTEDGTTQYQLDAAARRLIQEVQPGGVLLFRQNMQNVDQVKALVAEIRSLTTIPPFIAIDEEGGRVSRLKWLSESFHMASARTMALRGDQAIKAGYDFIGAKMAELGLNMDFAPVADLGLHPELEFLGDRTFSAEANRVGEAVAIAVQTLQGHGVLAVVKHFPGHGRATGDSHLGSNVIGASTADLAQDLIPFQAAFAAGAAAVMSAHVSYPAYDKSGLPASLSAPILRDLARNRLGFQGLIITDALEMRGIKAFETEEAAAAAAFLAGADMLMGPTNPTAVRDGLLRLGQAGQTEAEKVNSERLRQRLNESYRRIMKFKHQFGLVP